MIVQLENNFYKTRSIRSCVRTKMGGDWLDFGFLFFFSFQHWTTTCGEQEKNRTYANRETIFKYIFSFRPLLHHQKIGRCFSLSPVQTSRYFLRSFSNLIIYFKAIPFPYTFFFCRAHLHTCITWLTCISNRTWKERKKKHFFHLKHGKREKFIAFS